MVYSPTMPQAMHSQRQMTLNQAFEEAVAHFKKKEFQKAADLCASIHEAMPEFTPAYKLMAEMSIAAREFEKSLYFADQALKYEPDNPNFMFQRAKAFVNMLNWVEAESAIRAAIAQKDDDAMYYVILATALQEQGKKQQALEAVEQSLAIHDLPIAQEQKIQLLIALGRLGDARDAILAVIEKIPGNARAHQSLGAVLVQMGALDDAKKSFETAIQYDPSLAESHDYLGVLAFRTDDFERAIACAQKAVQLKPDYAHAKMIWAKSLIQLKREEEAEALLRQAQMAHPNEYSIQDELCALLVARGKKDEALALIDAALVREPNNAAMKHLKAAFSGETTKTAPESYVAKLFDEYAEKFDSHLQKSLSYSTPDKMATQLRAVWAAQSLRPSGLSLLDLGCGTGLGAKAIEAETDLRVGVDLSPKMVEQAKSKGLYAEAYVNEIARFMDMSERQYDVVMCADVLVYIGDLEPTFKAAKVATRPGGLFAISVEDGDDAAPYTIRDSGRYAHAASYIESLAAKHGFAVVSKEHDEIRKERGQSMMGHLFVLQA